jgi:CheY-like chemotaxis protein
MVDPVPFKTVSFDLEAVAADLRHILRQWHSAPSEKLRSQLIILQNYGEPQATEDIHELVLNALDQLELKDPLAASILRQRFLDGEMVYVLANRHNVSENMIYRRQREALSALASIVLAKEQALRTRQARHTLRRLPEPTYHTLYGIERPYQRLEAVLVKLAPPWLIAVDGLGGIGKTSLVDYLVRNVTERGQFAEIAWVSARRHTLALSGQIIEVDQPALHISELIDQLVDTFELPLARPFEVDEAIQALRQHMTKPHIIVVDNMETVIDYRTVLPVLRQLANPSKVIITSRSSLGDEPNVHCTSLAELDRADAAGLLKSEAEVRGIDALAEAPPDLYDTIYQTVGGNPLALKIVAGLARVRDIPSVLVDLREGREGRADALYTYVYREAWEILPDEARRTLLMMPLVAADGGTLEHLMQVTGLARDPLNQALGDLIIHSLVYVGGNLQERRYYIHGLTETFLRQEVAKWQ